MIIYLFPCRHLLDLLALKAQVGRRAWKGCCPFLKKRVSLGEDDGHNLGRITSPIMGKYSIPT